MYRIFSGARKKRGARTGCQTAPRRKEAGYDVRFHVFGGTHYAGDPEATAMMRAHYFPPKATARPCVSEMRPSGNLY